MHARPVGVEDARDLDVKPMLPVIVEKQGFGTAFAFVVTGARSVRIDVAPIILTLRMDGRVAVNLGGRCLENPAFEALGKAQHVDGPVHARLGRLHWIVLIVDGRGRASEVIDFVDFDIERKGHIVPQELKAGIADQMLDIPLGAGEEIVGAELHRVRRRSAARRDASRGSLPRL